MKNATPTVAQVTRRVSAVLAERGLKIKAKTVKETIVVDNFNCHFLCSLCEFVNMLIRDGVIDSSVCTEQISINQVKITFK